MKPELLAAVLVLSCITAPVAGAQTPVAGAGSDAAAADAPPVVGTSLGAVDVAPGEVVTLEFDAPLPVRSLGLWWEGHLGEAWYELVDADGAGLGTHAVIEAHDLDASIVGPERPAGAARVSGLVHAYDGPAVGARLTLFGPARVDALTAVWIGPGATPTRPDVLPTYGGGHPKPFVYDRASWGAFAPQCGVSYCTTTHVGLHHSASSSDFLASTWSQAAANVKSIQSYHMFTNGWCDVGYNYLVSKQGWLFEGRAGGDNVKGAHDGKNCGSMGVCAMGYFHPPVNNAPTAALLAAFADLTAWKCAQQGIDPLGSSWYAGLGAVEQNIYGHRDVSSTACPGDALYAALPGLRQDVAALLSGGPGGSGTLKGVLYNASIGTSARIAGGTVALADGTFAISASDGYYEFPLPAGTYQLGATAPGFAANASVETVGTGDIWESLGLAPKPGAPSLVITPLTATTFRGTTSAAPGSLVWFGYAGFPGLPIVPFGAAGDLWCDLATLQALFVGSVPGTGVLNTTYQVTGAPSGLTLHGQGYVLTAGQATLTNGAAWQAP